MAAPAVSSPAPSSPRSPASASPRSLRVRVVRAADGTSFDVVVSVPLPARPEQHQHQHQHQPGDAPASFAGGAGAAGDAAHAAQVAHAAFSAARAAVEEAAARRWGTPRASLYVVRASNRPPRARPTTTPVSPSASTDAPAAGRAGGTPPSGRRRRPAASPRPPVLFVCELGDNVHTHAHELPGVSPEAAAAAATEAALQRDDRAAEHAASLAAASAVSDGGAPDDGAGAPGVSSTSTMTSSPSPASKLVRELAAYARQFSAERRTCDARAAALSARVDHCRTLCGEGRNQRRALRAVYRAAEIVLFGGAEDWEVWTRPLLGLQESSGDASAPSVPSSSSSAGSDGAAGLAPPRRDWEDSSSSSDDDDDDAASGAVDAAAAAAATDDDVQGGDAGGLRPGGEREGSLSGPHPLGVRGVQAELAAFVRQHEEVSRAHGVLLAGFDAHVADLRDTVLHPALCALASAAAAAASAAAPSQLLIHHVPIDKLLAWRRKCAEEHARLRGFVRTLRERFAGVESDFARIREEIPASRAPLEVADALLRAAAVAARSEELVRELREDDEAAARQLQDLHARGPVPTDADAVGALFDRLEIKKARHARLLEELRMHEESIHAAVAEVAGGKARFALEVRRLVRAVLQVQRQRVPDLRDELRAYQEMLEKQQRAFGQLEFVANMKESYDAGLRECARRRGFDRRLAALLSCVNRVLTTVHAREQAARLEFKRTHARFLPKTILPALWPQEIPDYAINVDAFLQQDAALPDVGRPGAPAPEEVDAWVASLLSECGLVPPPPAAAAAAAAADAERLESEKRWLMESMSGYAQRIADLEARLDAAHSAAASLEEARAAAAADAVRASKRADELAANLEDARADIAARAAAAGSEDAARAAEEVHVAHAAAAQAAEAKLAVCRSQIARLEQYAGQEAQKRERAEENFADVQQALEDARAERDTAQAQAAGSAAEVHELRSEVAALRGDNAQLVEMGSQRESSLAHLIDRFAAVEESLECANTDLPEEADRLAMLHYHVDRVEEGVQLQRRRFECARDALVLDFSSERAALKLEIARLEQEDAPAGGRARLLVAVSAFRAGDVVFFFSNENGDFEAFAREGEPRHFLHMDCLEMLRERRGKMRSVFLGRVVVIEERPDGSFNIIAGVVGDT